MNNKETFSYIYSAKEQDEIKKIREKYIPKEADKMEQLRRLDESATKKGTVVSLIMGVTGILLFGLGMSCCMVWGDSLFAMGIVFGIAGLALAAPAYNVYNFITKKEREKIAPEILKLADELIK